LEANFICAAPALRGRVGERAGHLLPNTLNRAAADAKFAGNLQDGFGATQLRLEAFFKRGIVRGLYQLSPPCV
jgi:hypothetical protein